MATGASYFFPPPHATLVCGCILDADGCGMGDSPSAQSGTRSGSDPCPLLGDVCMGTFSLWAIKRMQWLETRSIGATSALAFFLFSIGIFRLVLCSNTAQIL